MTLGATKASGGGGNTKGGNSKAGSGKHNHVSSSHNHHSGGGGKGTSADKTHHKTHMAQTLIIDPDDAGSFQKKIQELMEMTRRSEAEVCSALHDCDQDVVKACDMLFEDGDKTQGQWQTKEKKKKKSAPVISTGSGGNITASGGSGNHAKGEDEDSGADGGQGRDHRPPRGRSNSRPYRGRSGGDYHNSADGDTGGDGGRGARRGGRGGPVGGGRGGRGGGMGRGGRGGGRGGRGGGGRGRPSYNSGGSSSHNNEMESWDNVCAEMGNDTFPPAEDWDNEEWSGSLADTKVFTPSAPNMGGSGGGLANSLVTGMGLQQGQNQDMQDLHSVENAMMQDGGLVDLQNSLQQDSTPDYLKQQGLDPSQNVQSHLQDPAVYSYSSNLMGLSNNPANSVSNSVSVSNTGHHSMNKVTPVVVSATLSAAQSQYLSQLTQKSSDALKQDPRNFSQVYGTNYGVYGATDISSQRKPLQRVRVPPPSKIPSSAVEMPGEQLGSASSVGLLDVQFGALDFSESNAFLSDGVPNDSYSNNTSSALDHHGMSEVSQHSQHNQQHVSSQQQQQSSQLQQQNSLNSIVSSSASGVQQSMSGGVVPSQQTADHQYSTSSSQQMLTSDSLSAAVAIEQQQQNSSSGVTMSSAGGVMGGVTSMSNSSSGINTSASSASAISSSNNPNSMGSGVQSNVASHQQHYSSSQQSRSQQSVPISQHPVSHLTTVSSLESQLTGASKSAEASAQPSAYSSYPGQTYSSKQQAYHPTHHTYQTNPYSQVNSSSFTAASGVSGNVSVSYPPSNTLNQYQPINTYQNSSVYGNSGLYTASNVPYNSYQALQASSNKITSNVKDSQYDTTVTTAANSLSNTPPTQTVVKTTISSGKSSVSSSVSSVGGGGHVGAVMGQYIMGTQPFYQQPVPYSYEDMQMLHQRLPQHVAGYYDMGYTSSRGPPDASMPSFPSLSSDARFGRSGGASSPSQQGGASTGAGAVAGAGGGAGNAQSGTTPTAAQQQGIVAPYTAYFYSAPNMMAPGGYQAYGTPSIYPIATAGGTGSSSYGSGKGGYVGTTYGAPQPQQQQPYEQQQPSQQQDYKTGSYSSSQQSSGVKQSSGGVNNTTSGGATDLNNSMYGPTKTHVSLNKVNSYEKAAYHSGTPPPPFGLGAAGTATVGGGAYTAGPHQLYIQHGGMPPPPTHQQMDGRITNNHRRDNGTNSSRTGASGQSKPSAKQGYSNSYWNAN